MAKKLAIWTHFPGEEQIVHGLCKELLGTDWTTINMLSHRERNQPMHRCPHDIDGCIRSSHPHTICLAPFLYGRPYDQKRGFGFLDLTACMFQIKHQLIQRWMAPGKVPIGHGNLE